MRSVRSTKPIKLNVVKVVFTLAKTRLMCGGIIRLSKAVFARLNRAAK